MVRIMFSTIKWSNLQVFSTICNCFLSSRFQMFLCPIIVKPALTFFWNRTFDGRIVQCQGCGLWMLAIFVDLWDGVLVWMVTKAVFAVEEESSLGFLAAFARNLKWPWDFWMKKPVIMLSSYEADLLLIFLGIVGGRSFSWLGFLLLVMIEKSAIE